MTTATSRAATLDRAYVQSRVIEASLERLAETLREVEPELRDDLASYVRRFDEYVLQLRSASASSAEGSPERGAAD